MRTEQVKRKGSSVKITESEKKMFKEAFNTDKARLEKRHAKYELRLWFFLSHGPIETTFRKYTFHKNHFFYPHRAKNGQKMPKKGQK